jgi:putative heme degradation protein
MADTVTLQISEDQLLDALRRLTPERRRELLARLGERQMVQVVTVPIEQIEPLIGILSIGGDALEDSERLYDGED